MKPQYRYKFKIYELNCMKYLVGIGYIDSDTVCDTIAIWTPNFIHRHHTLPPDYTHTDIRALTQISFSNANYAIKICTVQLESLVLIIPDTCTHTASESCPSPNSANCATANPN